MSDSIRSNPYSYTTQIYLDGQRNMHYRHDHERPHDDLAWFFDIITQRLGYHLIPSAFSSMRVDHV